MMTIWKRTALAAALVAISQFARASAIDESRALAAASGFLARSAAAKAILPGRTAQAAENRGNIWIVGLAPSGHIVVAGSSKCPPVASFSPDDFVEPAAGTPFAEKLRLHGEWCSAMEADSSAEDDPAWETLCAPRAARLLYASAPAAEALCVAPLLNAAWTQGAPYNDLTPLNCPCGCMATAGGQEFRYWQWPWRMETVRTVAHRLQDHENHVIRLDGSVPFDYSAIAGSYAGAATPDSLSKKSTYECAHLVLWAQSLVKMIFAPGASGGSQKLNAEAATHWYEQGVVMNKRRNGYDALWAAIKEDLDFGSPIQVNTPNHQMVLDGYAVEGEGDDEKHWVNINYGWGSGITWVDLKTEIESRQLADFQIGFRPQKRVQFEPLPKISATDVTVVWRIPPCYTNRVDSFALEVAKLGDAASFADDFSDSPGTASNARFAPESGYLGGYPGESGVYTYPGTFFAAAGSVLSFDAKSRYMSGHTATVEASFNGGGWETICTIPLTPGKNPAYEYSRIETDLSAHAGEAMQIRFRLACSWPGYVAGGSADFRIDNVSLDGVKSAASTETIVVPASAGGSSRYSQAVPGLESGAQYAFTVVPVMSDGSDAKANTAVTEIGEPSPAPEILSISGTGGGLELVQEGFFAECVMGAANTFTVTCSQGTAALRALPSHPTVLPDDKVSVSALGGGVFAVSLDASAMDSVWEGDMMLLTLVAANADGDETALNMMLRFSSVRKISNGTFEAIGGEVSDPVSFCGSATTIDAQGRSVVYKQGSFLGAGTVTLADGTFVFEDLDGFTGVLSFGSGATVVLPADLSGFSGTIAGDIEVASGEMTIPDASRFTGSIAVAGGTLEVNAGDEDGITLSSGVLRIKLSERDAAFGYSAAGVGYTGGSVVFVEPDGTETAAAYSGGTFAFAAQANVWTGVDAWMGERYTQKWSGALPSEGDYVVFNDASTDGFGALMIMNLSSDLRLGYVKATGAEYFEVGKYANETTATLYADVLENEVPFKIGGTYFRPSAIVPRAEVIVANDTFLDCDIDWTLAQNLKTYHGGTTLRNAITYADHWNGTVVFKDCTLAGVDPGDYGNAQSAVRFSGVEGWLAANLSCATDVELADSGDAPALLWNNGSSSATAVFSSFSGTGTLKTALPAKGGGEKVLVKDVSRFSGSFDLSAKVVAIGAETMPTQHAGVNDGRLHVCGSAAVHEGAKWKTADGVFLAAAATLSVTGAVETTQFYAYGEGASLELADGGTLSVSRPSTGGLPFAMTFRAGTLKASASIYETNAVDFCAAEGMHTTLDACGNKITLGAGVLSGAGSVYFTSSTGGGEVEVEGIGESFTGTIVADGSTSVVLPDDLSGAACTISISGTSMAREAGREGRIVLGPGAVLTLSLSAEQAAGGYAASGVTLAGGTVEFTDSAGVLLSSSAESAVYTPPSSGSHYFLIHLADARGASIW